MCEIVVAVVWSWTVNEPHGAKIINVGVGGLNCIQNMGIENQIITRNEDAPGIRCECFNWGWVWHGSCILCVK